MLYDLQDSDATGIPYAVLFYSPQPGQLGHPGRVVTVAVPGRPQRVVMVSDGDHLPDVYQHLDDHFVTVGVTDGIAAGFLMVPAKVNTCAQHPVWGWTETPDLDGLSISARGAVVHHIRSVADHLGGFLGVHTVGQIGITLNKPF